MHANDRWGNVSLDVDAGANRRPPIPEDDTPFRILVLADLRGRGSREGEATPVEARRPIRVDRDDLDDAMSALSPTIVVGRNGGEPITIAVRCIDDFHPDHLFDTLPHFGRLRDLRARLSSRDTFDAAARELMGDRPDASPRDTSAAAAQTIRPGHVLDAILGEPLDDVDEGASGDPLTDLIRQSIAPYLVPNEDPRRETLTAKIDELIAAEMRRVLHQPAFQAVESVWRGIALLTRRLETGESLQIHVLDVTASELVSDVAAGADSPLARALAAAAREHPWAVIAGAFTFGWDDADLAVLDHLASIAARLGAPFVAGAAPRLVGAHAFNGESRDWSRERLPAWEQYRTSPNAVYTGLVAPRFLGRAPYGEDNEPCERFAFEEFGDEPAHGELLWVNGALACACLLGEAFAMAGWKLRPGMQRELDGLPFCTVGSGADARQQPVAELLLTERAAAGMMDAGVMPLASLRDQGAALLVRVQSVAQPLAALVGRWARTRDA